MATEYPFVRQGSHLVATIDESREALAAVKDGKEVLISFRAPRNIRHHKLLFVMFRFVRQHVDTFPSIEAVKTALKIAVGHVDTYIDHETGETYYVPKSISFAAMPQQEFNAFFDDACNVIANRWMPAGTTPESVRAELLSMVDGPGSPFREAAE